MNLILSDFTSKVQFALAFLNTTQGNVTIQDYRRMIRENKSYHGCKMAASGITRSSSGAHSMGSKYIL